MKKLTVSTGGAAKIIRTALIENGRGSVTKEDLRFITSDTTRLWWQINAFHPFPHGMHPSTLNAPGKVQIEHERVQALAGKIRYIADPSTLDSLVYWVPVLPRETSLAYAMDGQPIRTHRGIDYGIGDVDRCTIGDCSTSQFLLGFEAAWSVADELAQQLVDAQATLIAGCRGLVLPRAARRIVDYDRTLDGSVWFQTTEPSPEVRDRIGDGIVFRSPGGATRGRLAGGWKWAR